MRLYKHSLDEDPRIEDSELDVGRRWDPRRCGVRMEPTEALRDAD
jgi:hypothetical protein